VAAPVTGRAEPAAQGRRGGVALAAVYLLPTFAALLQLEVAYLSVSHACRQGSTMRLHVESAVALLLALGGVRVGWRAWSAAGGGWDEEGADPAARTRFLAANGVLLGVLFVLVIVAMWLPIFFLDPCA
jgi:hypothetical protein